MQSLNYEFNKAVQGIKDSSWTTIMDSTNNIVDGLNYKIRKVIMRPIRANAIVETILLGLEGI